MLSKWDPIAMLIYVKGTPEEMSSFRDLEVQQKKLLASDESPAKKMLAIAERKETGLVLAIKHRERDAERSEGTQANAFAAFVRAKGMPMDVHHFQGLEKELLAIEKEQIKLVRDIKHRKEKRF
mmetsp:Transcript_59320/g.126107  ORF Transcript_59320/g.126107 Transcript_59320/m.126107 type:complete len:124 (+) Transcript_59320:230-601(+)